MLDLHHRAGCLGLGERPHDYPSRKLSWLGVLAIQLLKLGEESGK